MYLENADFVLTAVSYSLSRHGQGENFCKDDLAKRASVLNHLLQSCTRICVYKFDFQINKILSRIVQRSSPEIPDGDDGEVRDREGREYNICEQIVFAILFGHVQEIYFLIFEYLI